MRKIASLLLSVVFLSNALVPAAWGQRVPSFQTEVQQTQQEISALQQKIKTEKDPVQLVKYRQQLEELRAKKDRQEQQQSLLEQYQKPMTHPASSTRVQLTLPVFEKAKPTRTDYDFFEEKVRQDEIRFDDLIEYADPIADASLPEDQRPVADLRTIIFASEMFGNTIQTISPNTDPETLAYVLDALVVAQPRLLFQLYSLEKKYLSTSNANLINTNAPQTAIMAIGTLRITLLKIKQFYERMGIENPVKFSKGTKKFQVDFQANEAIQTRQNPQFDYNFKMGQQTVKEPANYSAGLPSNQETYNEIDPFARILHKFERELQTYAAVNKAEVERHEEDWSFLYSNNKDVATHYDNAQLLTEYATLYAILYGGDALEQIVKIFDEGPRRDGHDGPYIFQKYNTPNAPFLNTVFTNLFETVRYSDISTPQAKNVIAKLKNFSDKSQYSLPTVVFALEAASLMFKPHNNDYFTSRYTTEQQKQLQELQARFTSFFKLDPKDRQLFAARVAEIYCLLKNSKKPEFGLDSSQMEQLSNKLAGIYNNFYDIASPVISRPGTNAHPHPATSCEITLQDNLNVRARSAEELEAILIFVRDSIFWAYAGGPLFSALGNAYRMARGALAVLPKAQKAFNAAQMGAKTKSAFQVMRNGAQGSKLIQTARANNIRIVRTVPQTAPAKTKALVPGDGVQVSGELAVADARATGEAFTFPNGGLNGLTVELKEVKSVRNLRSGRSRWLGRKLPQEENVFAIQSMPDGSINIAKLEDPLFFRGKGYDELTLDAFVPVKGSGPLQHLSLLDTQAAKTQSLLSQFFMKDKPFTPFIPLKDGRWVNMAKLRVNTEEIAWDFANQPVILTPTALSGDPLFTTAQRLLANGAFESNFLELKTGAWANRAINTYFTKMDYAGNPVSQYFLPRYVINKKGLQALDNSFSFGFTLLKTVPFNNLPATMLGFGGLHLIDAGVFPLYKGYVGSLMKTDFAQEKAKYPALNKDLLDKDILYQQMTQGVVGDTRAMDTYSSVMGAAKQRKLGSSIIFPIVAARRTAADLGIGTFNVLPPSEKRNLEKAAIRRPFQRALRQRQQVHAEKQQQMKEQFLQQQENITKDFIAQYTQKLLNTPWAQDLEQNNPSSYKQVQKALQTLEQTLLKIQSQEIPLDQKKKQTEKAFKRLEQVIQPLQAQYDYEHPTETLSAFLQSLIPLAVQADTNVPLEGIAKWEQQWVLFAKGYENDILRDNPTIAKYSNLKTMLEDALHLYVDNKVALYNVDEKQAALQHELIDETLYISEGTIQKMAAIWQQNPDLNEYADLRDTMENAFKLSIDAKVAAMYESTDKADLAKKYQMVDGTLQEAVSAILSQLQKRRELLHESK